jgi:molecular chaperone DnaK (HSP70)
MSKKIEGLEGSPPLQETIEAKKERLRPLFQESLEVWIDPDRSPAEGALIVTQRFSNGRELLVRDLIVMTIEEDAVEFGVVEPDGEIGASAFMSWDSIIDSRKS